jgi:hypothetical protein
LFRAPAFQTTVRIFVGWSLLLKSNPYRVYHFKNAVVFFFIPVRDRL